MAAGPAKGAGRPAARLRKPPKGWTWRWAPPILPWSPAGRVFFFFSPNIPATSFSPLQSHSHPALNVGWNVGWVIMDCFKNSILPIRNSSKLRADLAPSLPLRLVCLTVALKSTMSLSWPGFFTVSQTCLLGLLAVGSAVPSASVVCCFSHLFLSAWAQMTASVLCLARCPSPPKYELRKRRVCHTHLFFLIEVSLVYNIVLVSGAQRFSCAWMYSLPL